MTSAEEASILNALTLGTSKEVLKNTPSSPLAVLLQAEANSIVKKLRESMTKYKVEASGHLQQSTNPTDIIIEGNKVSIAIESDFYWKFVNYGVNGTLIDRGAPNWGSQPQAQSFDSMIQAWIRNKGITTTDKIPTYEGLSFVIRKSIREKGKAPRPFFTDVVNKALQQQLREPIEHLLKRTIELRIIEPWQ
jgi:hypothetical protein